MNRKPPSRLQQYQAFVAGLMDGSSIRFGKKLSRLEQAAHFAVLVARNFTRNRCPARAAALSYTTLLALIPMLAVVLSVTSGMLKGESEERIDQFIDKLVINFIPPATSSNAPIIIGGGVNTASAKPEAEPAPAPALVSTNAASLEVASTNAPGDADLSNTNAPSAAQVALATLAHTAEVKDVRKSAAREIRTFIQNTRSGTLGVTGSIALVILAIMMLARIEDTFNDIWGVVRGRTWFLRIVLYWAVVTLAPLLLISALGLASGPHLDTTRALLTTMPLIGSLIFQFLPIIVLWLAFAAFYMLVPNTKVEWTAALAGGWCCAVLWHFNNLISVLYVSRVVTNFKIYGGLGMVPVFMAGLYLSWLFLLLGAQVAYAWQHRAAYLQEKLAERIDQRGREFIALRLMTCVGQYFQSGEPAAPVAELSASLGVPNRLGQQIMRTLKTAGLVSEVAGPEQAYVPARPLESITCHDILLAMRTTDGQALPKDDEPATHEVLGEFERIQAAERAAAGAVTLLALVNRAQVRLQLTTPAAEATTRPLSVAAAPSSFSDPAEAKAVRAFEMETAPESPETAALSETEPRSVTPPKSEPRSFKGEPRAEVEAVPARTASDSTPAKPSSPTPPTEDEERTFPL